MAGVSWHPRHDMSDGLALRKPMRRAKPAPSQRHRHRSHKHLVRVALVIYVTPLSKLDDTLRQSGARHLVSMLRADVSFQRPHAIDQARHLRLDMNDIVEERLGLVAPSRVHVQELLHFVGAWDRQMPLVIHCHAGISRSTAAAYVTAAALSPTRSEAELASTLRTLSPSATPNICIVDLADGLLGRSGRMTEAVRAIGRGADAFEGNVFALPLGTSQV